MALKKFIKYNRNIRDNKKKVSDDEAIIINLEKCPKNIVSFMFLVKIPKLVALTSNENLKDAIKHARFGLEDY